MVISLQQSQNKMQLAVRTRGYSNDYEWLPQPEECQTNRHQLLGAVIADDAPGFLIRKNEEGRFDIILVGIKREGKTDFRGRQIGMQLFIGGLDERKVRGIAVGALQDWNESINGFAWVIQDIPKDERENEKSREWTVDWEKLESFVGGVSLANTTDLVLTDAWEDDQQKSKESLLNDLQCCNLSLPVGYKIYWGASPNSSDYVETLRKEADRFCWAGCVEKIDLTEKRREEEARRIQEQKKNTPKPEPEKPPTPKPPTVIPFEKQFPKKEEKQPEPSEGEHRPPFGIIILIVIVILLVSWGLWFVLVAKGYNKEPSQLQQDSKPSSVQKSTFQNTTNEPAREKTKQ
jgi:hypothetical protein